MISLCKAEPHIIRIRDIGINITVGTLRREFISIYTLLRFITIDVPKIADLRQGASVGKYQKTPRYSKRCKRVCVKDRLPILLDAVLVFWLAINYIYWPGLCFKSIIKSETVLNKMTAVKIVSVGDIRLVRVDEPIRR